MRVALVVPFHDMDAIESPAGTLERQDTLRGLVEAAAGRGVQVRGYQLHRESAEMKVGAGVIEFVAVSRPALALAEQVNMRFPRHGPAYYLPSVRLFRRALESRPDVIHVFGLDLHPSVLVARLAAKRGRAVLTVSFHGGLPPRPGLTGLVSKAGLAGALKAMFTAREQAQPWIDAGLLRPDQVAEVMETSTSIRPIDRAIAHATTGLGGDPVCVSLARMDRVKDPLTTLSGFAVVAERLPEAHLHWFAAPTDLGDAVRAAAGAMPLLAGRVTFHDYQRRHSIAALLSAADYLIQSSSREWSSLAVLEAMACGAIPIVSDIPPMRRLTRGGTAGRLFRAGKPVALADALMDAETTGRDRLRSEVLAQFESALSFDALSRDLIEVWNGVRAPRVQHATEAHSGRRG